MLSYTKIYMDFFDLGMQDVCQCEICMREGRIDGEGWDLHHIWGRIGDKQTDVKNIMLLCRTCHEKIHQGKLSKSECQLIHNNVMQGNRKIFIK